MTPVFKLGFCPLTLKTPPDRPAKPAESVVTAVRRETKVRVAMMNLLDENAGWNP
jgi:hypothetical protein